MLPEVLQAYCLDQRGLLMILEKTGPMSVIVISPLGYLLVKLGIALIGILYASKRCDKVLI